MLLHESVAIEWCSAPEMVVEFDSSFCVYGFVFSMSHAAPVVRICFVCSQYALVRSMNLLFHSIRFVGCEGLPVGVDRHEVDLSAFPV